MDSPTRGTLPAPMMITSKNAVSPISLQDRPNTGGAYGVGLVL